MAKAKAVVETMPLSLQDIIRAEIAQAIAGLAPVVTAPAVKAALAPFAREVRSWKAKEHKISTGGFGYTVYVTTRGAGKSFGSIVWDDLAEQLKAGKL
jgi:P2-related tail formation protein